MMFAAAAASSIKLNDFPWDLTAFSVTLLCKAWLVVLELRTEMRAELSILLSRIQILCFLLALKGITSGMIWDAATSAKGQMSIGREDLVVLPPASSSLRSKLSCAASARKLRPSEAEAEKH